MILSPIDHGKPDQKHKGLGLNDGAFFVISQLRKYICACTITPATNRNPTMTTTSDQEPKAGRPPSGNPEQKTRAIRLDDHRWFIYRNRLGTSWLRKKIDEEEASMKQSAPKTSDQ